MQIESCGDPRAVSSAGAMGLFQVMPFHFHATDDPYNPNTNAARGLDYLVRSLATANGDARLAMAGYNGGIGVIPRAEWTWSAQTKRYVQYGAPIYYDAVNGLETSDALNDWYSSYGVSLCRQAHQRLACRNRGLSSTVHGLHHFNIFNQITNVVPFPSFDSTLICPPWCSTIQCAMDKPSPNPLVFERVRDFSAR